MSSEFPPQPSQDELAAQAAQAAANNEALQQNALSTPVDPNTIVETTATEVTPEATTEASVNEPSEAVRNATGIADARRQKRAEGETKPDYINSLHASDTDNIYQARRERRLANRQSTVSFVGHSVLGALRSSVGLGGQGRDAAAILENAPAAATEVPVEAPIEAPILALEAGSEAPAAMESIDADVSEAIAELHNRLPELFADAENSTPEGNAVLASGDERTRLRTRVSSWLRSKGQTVADGINRGDARSEQILKAAERRATATLRGMGAAATTRTGVARERMNWRLHGVDMSTRPPVFTGKNMRGPVGQPDRPDMKWLDDLPTKYPSHNLSPAKRQQAFKQRAQEAKSYMAQKNAKYAERLTRDTVTAEATVPETPSAETPADSTEPTKADHLIEYDLSGMASAEQVNELMNRVAANEAVDLDSDEATDFIKRMALSYARANDPYYAPNDPSFATNVDSLRQQIKVRRTARQTANSSDQGVAA